MSPAGSTTSHQNTVTLHGQQRPGEPVGASTDHAESSAAAKPPGARAGRRIAPQAVASPSPRAAAAAPRPRPCAYSPACVFTPASLEAIAASARFRVDANDRALPRFATPGGSRRLPRGVATALRLCLDYPAWWARHEPLKVVTAPPGHRLRAGSWVNEYNPGGSARMVVAARRINSGSLLGVYAAKVLSAEETEARPPPPGIHGYIFDFGWDDITFDASEVRNAVPEIVDAREFGGLPDGVVPRAPRGAVNMEFLHVEDREEGRRYIIAVATHDIKAGQEVKCDYEAGGATYWENLWATMEANRQAAAEDDAAAEPGVECQVVARPRGKAAGEKGGGDGGAANEKEEEGEVCAVDGGDDAGQVIKPPPLVKRLQEEIASLREQLAAERSARRLAEERLDEVLRREEAREAEERAAALRRREAVQRRQDQMDEGRLGRRVGMYRV